MISLLLLSLLHTAELPETWTVKAGDTCDSIARATWGDGKKVPELHRWNDLGPPPHHLKAGMVLRLRAPTETKDEGPDATLTFLKPAVRTRHLIDWQPALLGMGLFRLDEVNTLKGAGAALRFKDLSTLLLDENALIVVYGDGKPKTPTEPTGVTLVDGELRVALAQLRAKPMAINTSGTKMQASGLNGVVAVDGAQTTRVSVFEGSSLVSAKGVTVTVPENHGTRVRSGQPPEPPRLLPETPVLTAPPAVVVVDESGLGSLPLRWAVAARAEQYKVQLGHDADFVDRERDAWTSQHELTLDRLPPGPLLLRLISFDEVGLQSRPSVSTRVEVISLGSGLDGQGELRLGVGQPLRFEVPASLRLQVAGKDAAVGATWPVGVFPLAVLGEDAAPKLQTVLVVAPRAPTVITSGTVVRATFTDEVPEALPPELVSNGVSTAFKRVSALVWELDRPAPGLAEIRWHGRPLSRLDVGASAR